MLKKNSVSVWLHHRGTGAHSCYIHRNGLLILSFRNAKLLKYFFIQPEPNSMQQTDIRRSADNPDDRQICVKSVKRNVHSPTELYRWTSMARVFNAHQPILLYSRYKAISRPYKYMFLHWHSSGRASVRSVSECRNSGQKCDWHSNMPSTLSPVPQYRHSSGLCFRRHRRGACYRRMHTSMDMLD